MSNTTGYLVVQAFAYMNDPESYTFCKTRREVEAQLVDFGYLDNPGVFVFKIVRGKRPEDVIEDLTLDTDPYPDYVVERGPRGGVRWEYA